jgi:sugar phosphate permease
MNQLSTESSAAYKKESRIFFGWWTLLATGVLNIVGQAFYSYGVSAFFKPIADELHFSRTVTSAAAGIGRLEGGLEAPLSGWLVDKFGPKWVIFGGVSLVAIGLLLMNLVHSAWTYYLVWGVSIGTGINLSMTIPIDKTLTNWFVKKRGLAVGIKFACLGIGGAAVVPLVSWLIANYGWRTTSTIWGILVFASLLLVVFFIRQKRPEHYGLLPDGAKIEKNISPAGIVNQGLEYASQMQEIEFTLRQALKTSAFWLYLIAYACQFLGQVALYVHLIPFLTDRGISPVAAGFLMGLMLFCTIPSRLITGIIADRIQKGYLSFFMALAFLFQALGIAAFLIKPGMPAIYVFLILYGFGTGAAPVLGVLMRGRFFGRKAYGSISGLSSFILGPVGIVAPIYAGWIYDTTHSYVTAFILFAALAAVATALICFVRPPKAPAQIGNTEKFI